MQTQNRRKFIRDISSGMLTVGLGTSLATDLGFSTTFADEGKDSIPLGQYTKLVELMRNTPPEKLQPLLANMIVKGQADLRQLISAGALANAVTFGGCDYVGFHTAMAMLPALQMSTQVSSDRAALPVLKVLYRNSQQIQSVGGSDFTTLHAVDKLDDVKTSAEHSLSEQIRDACRKADVELGESLLSQVGDSPKKAFNALQMAMQDDLNVHRFVFAHRTFGLVNLLGDDYSYSILRQCVRFCINHENNRLSKNRPPSPIRQALPKLLDQYKLEGKAFGDRDPGDDFVNELCNTIFNNPRAGAAEAVAEAIADGIHPEVIGEAISLASNQYVLRQGSDKWRTHGDSAGVHSSDASNAWRNMIRVADTHHAISGLLVAGYHVGQQEKPFQSESYPLEEHRDLIKVDSKKKLLAELEDSIRNNEQGRAAAAAQIYGERGYDVESAFELMLKYTISEDGRLHGEKYYHTVREEFETIRPAFRWRQVVGLARVTASAYGYNRQDEHGFRAAGYEDACKLLGVDA